MKETDHEFNKIVIFFFLSKVNFRFPKMLFDGLVDVHLEHSLNIVPLNKDWF